MAHKLRTHFRETSRLKSGVSWLPCAPDRDGRFQQPVDDLCVPGGQEVDTIPCVRPDSCICQKVVCWQAIPAAQNSASTWSIWLKVDYDYDNDVSW